MFTENEVNKCGSRSVALFFNEPAMGEPPAPPSHTITTWMQRFADGLDQHHTDAMNRIIQEQYGNVSMAELVVQLTQYYDQEVLPPEGIE
jgi:hypothetical protein